MTPQGTAFEIEALRKDGTTSPLEVNARRMEVIEARILGLADSVEAVLSHRPHRTALPLEAVLAEIESGRGTLYDPAAADACTRLFPEKAHAPAA